MKIEDYALIGDCHSAALVGSDGAIDWLCWPRFDSAACFAALLGKREHGRWRLAPMGIDRCVRRRYRGDSLILETDFETSEGAVTLVDFMPMRAEHCHLVRMVLGRRGRVKMEMEFILRFDYGASVPWVTRLQEGGDAGSGIRAVAGPDMVVLRSPVTLEGRELTTVAEFEVAAGERTAFVMTHGPSHLALPPPLDAERAFRDTEAFWHQWCRKCSLGGEYAPFVRRSLVTLKALTYAPTGGLVAAPTTSLPEQIGGVRNWDYRFCWLRDATLTLLALMNGGYHDEALAWRDWLTRAVAGSPEQMQIMYGLAGERRLGEWTVDWLPGYENSRPVRVGNAAAGQLQLDVYGELDASLLLIPMTGFLPCSDPRVKSTIEAIQKDLTHDGFVMRYRTRKSLDGLPPGEGVFLACSCWLADCLILLGRRDEARELFERICKLANDLGLLAEEYDPRTGRQLGNFPQAFTHVALVNTAMNLSAEQKPVEQRAEKKAA